MWGFIQISTDSKSDNEEKKVSKTEDWIPAFAGMTI